MTSDSVALRVASTPADIALARGLIVEYAQSLGVDLCFQGLDQELATLPGAYAPPSGRLMLAGGVGDAFGCVALRQLPAKDGAVGSGIADSERRIGEVKRLYVRPGQRGGGWGRKLADAVIADARAIGYEELRLDTLGGMKDAQRLYAQLGFRERPPYYDNPLPDVVYMSLRL